jgi:phosphatidylinositol alpha-mannosyltransferase
MRIALTHVTAWPEVRRGGERYLHELAAAFQDAGHDVRVLTSSASPGRGRVLGVETTRVRARTVPRGHFGSESREIAFAAQALLRLGRARLDVWHALGTADAAAAAELGRIRGWTSVYTSLGFPKRASRDQRADRRLHELVVRHVDHYVCLSHATGAFLRTDYGREPDVIGGGVDTRRFVPATTRHPHPVVLFSGSLDETRKNVPLLLDAFSLLRRRRPDAELWLSGPGDATALIRAAAPGVDHVSVKQADDPDDLVELYGRAWLTVLPSEQEAFGLALVESLACGTPIVTLDSGGAAELVQDGVGFRSTPSAHDLADACEAALELAGDAGVAAACREVALGYDWRAAVVPRLEAIYGVRR